ncbi:MAG TPA: YciI family protein [Thermoanaerobaculia bacterium]|nr:YciI family protein [Thermoanaerobaculia bacterium]
MKYLLLIYQNEQVWQGRSREESARIFDEYMDYTRTIHRNGNYIAGEALQPVATATTVRQRNGKTLTTDGPFAETKEQLGGFFLVEAKDLDEAMKLAGGIPAVRNGSIEVRPILPTPPVE